MSFSFKRLQIPEIISIKPKPFVDFRGFFYELFKQSDFNDEINTKFVQDNFSHSNNHVLRGLHYQKNPRAQAKLVTVLRGEIFDVAVDIRKDSSTYGKWISKILSEDNHELLYIPEGFAHGFCVLSKDANVFYKVNQEYSVEHDRGIIWNDPTINVSWPIKNPTISKKDLDLPQLKEANNDF